MLVAGLLVALRLGACEDIEGFTNRFPTDGSVGASWGILMNGGLVYLTGPGEACYSSAPVTFYDGARGACPVSDAYSCCTALPNGIGAFCIDASHERCAAESTVRIKPLGSPIADVPATYQWCGPPHNGNEGLAAGVAAGSAAFVVFMAAASA